METTFEGNLCKTEPVIHYDNNDYPSFYDRQRDKCYYKVNDEFLLIIDPVTVKEIKKSYKNKSLKFYSTIGSAIIAGSISAFFIIKYLRERNVKKRVQMNGKYIINLSNN